MFSQGVRVQLKHVDGVHKVHCAHNGTQYFPSLEVWGEAAAKGFVSRPLRRGGVHCYVSHPTLLEFERTSAKYVVLFREEEMRRTLGGWWKRRTQDSPGSSSGPDWPGYPHTGGGAPSPTQPTPLKLTKVELYIAIKSQNLENSNLAKRP